MSGRLKRISTVVETGAVTKEQDPNGLLGEKGGYTGCVYFLDERVDRELLPEEAFKKAPEEEEKEKKEDKDGEAGTDAEEEDTEEDDTSAGDAAEAGTSQESAAEAGTSAEIASESGTTAESAAKDGTSAESAAEDGTTAESAAEAGSSGDPEGNPASGSTAENADEGGTAAENAAASETSEPAASEEKDEKPKELIDVVMIGTVGGGAVEIFPTEEDAQARIEYLRFFEGSLMDPGAFDVEKTCVIRASKYLETTQQKELIEKIREELLATDE